MRSNKLKEIESFNSIVSSFKLLNNKERYVLIMRYGLLYGNMLTLDSVGKQLGITRERVRQIEHNAFNKINKQCQNLKE